MGVGLLRRGSRNSGRRRPYATPTLRSGSTSGGVASGTTATITLPAGWQATDYITLFVSTNQAPTLTITAGVNSYTIISNAASRLQVIRLVPTAGATTVTLTSSVSAVLTWWCGAWQNVDLAATVAQAANNIGNSTTAAVEVPVVELGYISTGYETYVSAAGVNSTAIWGTSPTPVFSTTTGNGALSVRSGSVNSGRLTRTSATAFDRGSEGSSRNESALCIILQPVQSPVRNLLSDGSFELGGGLATNWDHEFTAPRAATYTKSTTGVIDGASSQRMQFTGTTGDSGMVSMYQSPIAVNPGDTVTATIYLSGTLTNAYAIFGIEGFVTAGGTFISEVDNTIAAGSLTGTPTQYSVTYTCPANCTAVAVYFQIPTVAPTSIVDVYLDKAILLKV